MNRLVLCEDVVHFHRKNVHPGFLNIQSSFTMHLPHLNQGLFHR